MNKLIGYKEFNGKIISVALEWADTLPEIQYHLKKWQDISENYRLEIVESN